MSELSLNVITASPAASPSRPLIVLIHGGGLSHRMYRTTIPILSKRGYDVAAPDLPGHGSSVDLGPFTFQSATRLLINAIEDVKRAKQCTILLVGVSLGGQVVLNSLQLQPSLVEAAIVSGASIHPPDDKVQWEMPHMPLDQAWIDVMTEDIGRMGMENAQGIQTESFGFTFTPKGALSPTLVVVGENDIAMAKRDFEELAALAKQGNDRSESKVMAGAWHNHPIDVPEHFAAVIDEWCRKAL